MEDDIPKLNELLISHIHNEHVCPPAPPQHVWPSLKFSIKPGAVTHAAYAPATVPVHWQDQVKQQLGRRGAVDHRASAAKRAHGVAAQDGSGQEAEYVGGYPH
jgi:hypothetical protein